MANVESVDMVGHNITKEMVYWLYLVDRQYKMRWRQDLSNGGWTENMILRFCAGTVSVHKGYFGSTIFFARFVNL